MNNRIHETKVHPFEESIDINFFFPSPGHLQVLQQLGETAEQDTEPVVISGSPGTGKSLIMTLFAQDRRIVCIDAATAGHGQFLQAIARSLDVTIPQGDRAEIGRQLKRRLVSLRCHYAAVNVLVDNAQHFDDIDLEDLHELSQIRHQNKRMLRFVIAGSEPLVELMQAHPTLAQKCCDYVHLQLEPLPEALIRDYVNYHLEVGGAKTQLFAEEVFDEIYRYTGGIPRNVNELCNHALDLALEHTPAIVDRDTMRTAAQSACADMQRPCQPRKRVVPAQPEPASEPCDNSSDATDKPATLRQLLEYVRRELNLDERQSAMERILEQLKKTANTLAQNERQLMRAEEKLLVLEQRVSTACRTIDHQEASILEAVSNLTVRLEESEQRIEACVAADKENVSRSAATRQQMLEEYLVLRSQIKQHDREMNAAINAIRAESADLKAVAVDHRNSVAQAEERMQQFQRVVDEASAASSELANTADTAQHTLMDYYQSLIDQLRLESRQVQDHIEKQAHQLGRREKHCRKAQHALHRAAEQAQQRCNDIREDLSRTGHELNSQAKRLSERQEFTTRSLKKMLRHADEIKEQPEQLLQDVQSKVERMRALLESAGEIDAALQQTIRQSAASADSMNQDSQRLYRHYVQMQEQASVTLGDLMLQNDTAAQRIEQLQQQHETELQDDAAHVNHVPAPNSP